MTPDHSQAHQVRPLRIALLDPGDFTPSYDEALAQGLRRLGHEVVLIGSHGGLRGAAEVRRPHFYRLLAYPWSRRLPGGLARAIKGGHHIIDMARLLLALRRIRPDIIHFQWLPLPFVDASFVGALRGIAPLVLTVHDAEPYQGATNRLMTAGFARLLRRADALIVHTRATQEGLRRHRIDPHHVHQVPHGLLHPPATPDPGRRPRAGRRLRVLQFGKIKTYKGVDVLIEALGRLDPETRRLVHVRVAGAPYLNMAPLLERVRQLDLAAVVEFRLGFLPEQDMMRCFAEADALIFPYRQIDASGVLMAALAHGKPVVASRVGAFAELLEDGRDALLVQPGDADDLGRALTTLARAPERLEAMRDAVRQTRDAVPGWDEIGARTVAVYEQAHRRAEAAAARGAQARQRAGVPAR